MGRGPLSGLTRLARPADPRVESQEWTAEISSPTSPNPNEVLAVLTSGERSSWVRERLAATAGGRRRGRARRRAGEARGTLCLDTSGPLFFFLVLFRLVADFARFASFSVIFLKRRLLQSIASCSFSTLLLWWIQICSWKRLGFRLTMPLVSILTYAFSCLLCLLCVQIGLVGVGFDCGFVAVMTNKPRFSMLRLDLFKDQNCADLNLCVSEPPQTHHVRIDFCES